MSAQESGMPPLKPSRDLNEINKRLLELRNSKCHLIGPGVRSLVKMETLPEGYEVSWHCFLFDPRLYLDPGTDKIPGPHVYRDRTWPAGQVALKREALLQLWSSADGRYLHSQRDDDGRDPHYARYTWAGQVLSVSGIPRPEAFTKELDLRDGSALIQGLPDGMKRSQRANISQLCESKAQNRAIRALLGVSQTYREDEVGWPFVLMKLMFVPDMTDPAIKMLVTAHAIGAASALFGGPSGKELMKQLMAPRVDPDEVPQLGPVPAPSIPRQLNEVKLEPKAETKTETKAEPELPFSIPEPQAPPMETDTESQVIATLADYDRLEAAGAGLAAAALKELFLRNPNRKSIALKDTNFAGWQAIHRRRLAEHLLTPEPVAK